MQVRPTDKPLVEGGVYEHKETWGRGGRAGGVPVRCGGQRRHVTPQHRYCVYTAGQSYYNNQAGVCMYVMLLLDALHVGHQTFMGSSTTPHHSFIFLEIHPAITRSMNDQMTL